MKKKTSVFQDMAHEKETVAEDKNETKASEKSETKTDSEGKSEGKAETESDKTPRHATIREAEGGFIAQFHGGKKKDPGHYIHDEGKDTVHPDFASVMNASKKHFGIVERVKSGTEE